MSALSAKRAAIEEAEARRYADLILDGTRSSLWFEVNRSIIDRLSITALRRIKRRAWQIAETADS